MNSLIEMEANKLSTLFGHGDILGIRMFMEHMNIPLDVQDKLFDEISALTHIDQKQIGAVIEAFGQSQLSERLSY